MAKELISGQNITGLSGIFLYVDNATAGIFSKLLILTLFAIILFGYYNKTGDWFGGFLVSSFIVTILSTFGFFAGIILPSTFGIVIALFVIALVVAVIMLYVRR